MMFGPRARCARLLRGRFHFLVQEAAGVGRGPPLHDERAVLADVRSASSQNPVSVTSRHKHTHRAREASCREAAYLSQTNPADG